MEHIPDDKKYISVNLGDEMRNALKRIKNADAPEENTIANLIENSSRKDSGTDISET
ncbi:MAG: hypothetical protein ACLFVT_02450 [Syntrophobacteria bacterium]